MNRTNTRSLNRGGHHPAAIRGLAIAAFASAAFALSAAAETIAYWPFGTNGFHDVSGNGHDLVGVEIAESDDGYIVFNGTNSYLKTAAALDLSGEQQVTFECWARALPMKSSVGIILSSEAPMTAGGFVLYNNTQDPKYIHPQFRMTANDWQYGRDTLRWFNDNGWHHIAFTVDRTKTTLGAVQFYLDGSPAGTAGASGTVPAFFNGLLLIGGGCARYSAGDNFFAGYIDDVRVSRGILTKDEFMKYPSVGKTMRADSSELPVVAYWPFGGKGGKDATGNGFDLTMTGVPIVSGTPSPAYSTRNQQTEFYLPKAFPFSAFSRTGVTIECLSKFSTGATWGGILVESSPAAYKNPGSFRINYPVGSAAKMDAAFQVASNAIIEYETTEEEFGALNDDKWRHLALVYDPTKHGVERVAFYVDGVAVTNCFANSDTGADPFALLDANLYFTRRNNAAWRKNGSLYEDECLPFFGSLDDVRITAGVLKPEQFLAGRSAGSTVALYCFDKGTLEDQTGNGHELVNEGNATFGTGTHAASGTGLVLNGTSQWLHLKDALDLSHTKGMTVEFDCYDDGPHGTYKYWVYAGTDNPVAKGGFVVYRNSGHNIAGQFRALSDEWQGTTVGSSIYTLPGQLKGRFPIDTTANPSSRIYLNGVAGSDSANNYEAFDNLGSKMLCFGHSEGYGKDWYMKGKFRRIAISDVKLEQADFVLDNLPYSEAKRALAYWDFASSSDKSGNGHDLTESGTSRRNGAMALNGSGSATASLSLSGLTQATIECFVLFGQTPASGTLFSMGTGVGSFAVSGDVVAGTLSGTFVPYLSSAGLAAPNGGKVALAPLAGAKAWHHVALVIDRTASERDAVRFYVDYERAELGGRAWDTAARLLDGTFVIGANSTQDGGFFTGRIDDVRVSAGALEPAEFLQPSQRTGKKQGLIIVCR